MLIVLSKSPFAGSYDSILEIVGEAAKKGEKIGVLHIQDSCMAVTMGKYCERLGEIGVSAYVLKADCEARGLLKKVRKSVKIIDYKEWVKLVMEEHDKIVSWT